MRRKAKFAKDLGELHSGLQQMVDSGRLRYEHIPEDFSWLVGSLSHLQESADYRQIQRERAKQRALRKSERERRRVDIGSLRRASKQTGIPVKTLHTRARDNPEMDLDEILAIPHQPARRSS